MEATSSRAVRLLTAAHTASAIGDGSFYVTSALFLTRVVGLPDARVGLWLSIAWATGFALSTPIGSLADRIGLRGCAVGLSLVVAGTLALAPLVRHQVALLVVLTLYAVAQSGLIAVRQAIVAVAVPAADRVTLRARLHVAVNAGIGLGAALGGLALAVGAPTAYAVVLWADAAGFTVAAGLIARMPLAAQAPQPTTDPRSTGSLLRGGPRRSGRRSVLRDHPYIAAAALSALLYLYMPMLSVLLPLFLAGRTQAPTWAVAAVFVLNTVGVMLLQVQAARTVTSIPTASRAVRRGGLALAASALVFGAAALPGSPAVALTLVLAGAAVQVVGEVLLGAGSWHIGFTLAASDRPGQWQGLFSSGLPLARAVGPVVLSALVLTWTGPGWVVLAAVFAGAGLALRPVAGWAERRRPVQTTHTQHRLPAHAAPTSPAARARGDTR